LKKSISFLLYEVIMDDHFVLISLYLMTMEKLILLLSIRENNIMNLVLNLVGSEAFTNSNIMIIKKEDSAHCMILN